MTRLWLSLFILALLPRDPYHLLDGAVAVDIPPSWHLLSQGREGPEDAIYLHYRVPGMDSAGKDRVNIILRARRLAPGASFHAFTDTVLSQVVQPHAPVLSDTMLSDSSRAVLWRGQLRETPYAILDKFGRSGDVLIYVRSAVPLRADFSAGQQQEFSKQLDALFSSIRIHGAAPFPEASGIGIHSF